MGEYVSYTANISRGYENYLFTVCNKYGSTAERVIGEYFKELAQDIGKDSVIVYPMNEAIAQLEHLFKIAPEEERPVLILTDWYPDDILALENSGQKPEKAVSIIKIPLGRIHDEDRVKHVLFKLMSYIRSNDYGSVTWMNRKMAFDRILQNFGIVVSLVELFK